jgi:hypothetical protein
MMQVGFRAAAVHWLVKIGERGGELVAIFAKILA